jgi:hypothetical protein
MTRIEQIFADYTKNDPREKPRYLYKNVQDNFFKKTADLILI